MPFGPGPRFSLRRFSAPALGVVAFALILAVVAPPPAHGQPWEIKTADGNSSIKFGYLAVMRGDSEELANGENAENLYFRRLRLMFGGKLTEKWTYFFETDSPNLGKSDAAGVKNAGDVYIQDFFVTYEHRKEFKLDFGMILIPLSRNSTQSAVTHLASDYGPYSFLNSGPTQSRVGRDYGVQARGSLANDKFEYRLGIYDGNRGANASQDFRYSGRIMYHVFDAETGMFYTGNNLGGKRMLSFGAGFDTQDDYTAISADVFYDQPVGDDGSAFTFQADFINYDGGTTFTSLPEQDTLLLEAGYYLGASKWQPWIQYSTRDFSNGSLADEEQLYLGVNYRIKKHNQVVRVAYGQLSRDGADDRDVLQVTLQMFNF
jgi:Phosphate-selective porin O and P